MTNIQLFQAYVAEHLKKYGVALAAVILQTDNGSKNIGAWNKKTASAFTRQVETTYGMRHDRIPPHCSTYNSDVETFHNLIEREFYDIETFASLPELLGKATAYQLYFNYQRSNTWREGKAPYQLLRELAPHIAPQVLALPPRIVDTFLNTPLEGGYAGQADSEIVDPGAPLKVASLPRDRRSRRKPPHAPAGGGYDLPLLVKSRWEPGGRHGFGTTGEGTVGRAWRNVEPESKPAWADGGRRPGWSGVCGPQSRQPGLLRRSPESCGPAGCGRSQATALSGTGSSR